jgi:transposase-like protein
LDKIKAQLLEKLSDFKQKELPENALALFIDAYHTEVKDRGKVKKSCVYVVLGLDLDGHKDVYGFYTLFPKSDHQLCYVHLKKNVQRNMGKEDAKIFNKELDRIRQSNTFDEGRELFEVLCERFKEKYSSYIRTIREKVENYLCFLKYPEEVRRHIYTTNGVESINRLLEKIRERLGGYFQSVEILEINMYLQIESLRDGRWRKGIPVIKSKKYEISQIFNLKFYHDIQTQNY